MKEGLISIDIGTGSCRALLFDKELDIQAQASAALALHRPEPGRAEQDAEDVFQAVLTCLQQVKNDADSTGIQVAGITFSAAVCSLLLLDENDHPLAPASIWADRRAQAQARQLLESHGLKLYQRTGCPIHASYLPAKLAWWYQKHPEVLRKAHRLVSLKSYVLARLCGPYIEDISLASASGLLNVNNLTWDSLPLSFCEVEPHQLPEVVGTTQRLSLKTDRAETLGFRPDIPVICGAGDGVLSNLGAGAVSPNQVVTMVGSSGAVRMTRASPWLDLEGRTWCYPLIDSTHWVAGGANNCGGLVLDWVAERLLGLPVDTGIDGLIMMAKGAPAGSHGLVLLPTIFGERSPLWDEGARGVLFGLNDSHDQAHVMRATLEGIIFSLHSIYRVLRGAEKDTHEIRATGGYAQSDFWLGIQASVFQSPILVPECAEGSALGAAILGWVAVGEYPDVERGASKITIEREVLPVEGDAEVYDRGLETHAALYERLCEFNA